MSARACFRGLPLSFASVSESASWWSATARVNFIRRRPRSTAGSRHQAPSNAARAAVTAAPISRTSPQPICVKTSPSLGFTTGSVLTSAARHRPPISSSPFDSKLMGASPREDRGLVVLDALANAEHRLDAVELARVLAEQLLLRRQRHL